MFPAHPPHTFPYDTSTEPTTGAGYPHPCTPARIRMRAASALLGATLAAAAIVAADAADATTYSYSYSGARTASRNNGADLLADKTGARGAT